MKGEVTVKSLNRAWLVPGPARKAGMASHCKACGKTTADGKTHCEDHLDRIPYAAAIIATVQAFEEEALALQAILHRPDARARALKLATPCLDGEVMLSLALRTLELGATTAEGLARNIASPTQKGSLKPEVAMLVLHRLRSMGYATCKGAAKRGGALWAATPRGLTVHPELLPGHPIEP